MALPPSSPGRPAHTKASTFSSNTFPSPAPNVLGLPPTTTTTILKEDDPPDILFFNATTDVNRASCPQKKNHGQKKESLK
jgi:hypothetical protein